MKDYSRSLKLQQKDLLMAEKARIITEGMTYNMSREEMEAWGTLLDQMVQQIRSEEITNLN